MADGDSVRQLYFILWDRSKKCNKTTRLFVEFSLLKAPKFDEFFLIEREYSFNDLRTTKFNSISYG